MENALFLSAQSAYQLPMQLPIHPRYPSICSYVSNLEGVGGSRDKIPVLAEMVLRVVPPCTGDEMPSYPAILNTTHKNKRTDLIRKLIQIF